MLGVDAEQLGSLRISHPGELQDRAARGVQDQVLDLFGVAMDAMSLPAEQRDLRDRIHHVASGTPGQTRRVPPDRIESSRWLAPLISLLSIGLLASARTLPGGTRAQRCPMLAGSPGSEATARRRAAQCRALVAVVALTPVLRSMVRVTRLPVGFSVPTQPNLRPISPIAPAREEARCRPTPAGRMTFPH